MFLSARGPALTNWVYAQLSGIPAAQDNDPWAIGMPGRPANVPPGPSLRATRAAKPGPKFHPRQAAETNSPVSCQTTCRRPCTHQWCAPAEDVPRRPQPPGGQPAACRPRAKSVRGRRAGSLRVVPGKASLSESRGLECKDFPDFSGKNLLKPN